MLLVNYQDGYITSDGTIMLCTGRDDFAVETVFNKVFPLNRRADDQDCWLTDPSDWAWLWGDPLDVPEGSLLRLYIEDRVELNNHVECAGFEDNAATSDWSMNEERYNVLEGMTALPSSRNNEQSHDELDEWSSMQTHSRLHWDNGHTSISAQHFQYCIGNNVAWIWPIRWRYRELYWAWYGSHFDFVKTQFLDMEVPLGKDAMTGWIFRNPLQAVGDVFSWGMTNERPGSLQILQLMRSSQLQDSLLYTVNPQPISDAGVSAKSSSHIIVPWEGMPPMPQVLAIEHSLRKREERCALACSEPCSVRRLFRLAGLGEWCDRGTIVMLFSSMVHVANSLEITIMSKCQ